MSRGGVFIITTILSSFLGYGTAYAVDFDARDTRVDLPVLSTPNNAVNPKMSADQNGHVYVAWSDNRGGSPSIYTNTFFSETGWQPKAVPLTTGFPRTQGAEIGDATSPDVCSDNSGHVYVVWVDDRAVKAASGKLDIYFRYSKDYGLSWYPEFTDERIDSDNPAVGNSINPRIACDENGNVYAVWNDDRNRSGVYEVYFRSLHVEFSKPTDFITYYQTPELRLNTGVSAGTFAAIEPVISTDKGGYIYVAWQDSRSIPDPEEEVFPGIYFNVSSDHGTKWGSKAIRIDRAPIGGFLFFSPPVISSDSSGHVYAAWLDNAGRAARGEEFASDGTSDVYFNRSLDFGANWDERDQRIDTPKIKAQVVDVAIANNTKGVIGIVWTDNRGANKLIDPNDNIYFNHSMDFGRSFLDTKGNIRLDTGIPAGDTSASSPLIQVDNLGDMFVAWLDNRSGTSDIFFNFSIGKGKADSWQDPDIRLDYPVPSGDSINPVMSIDNEGHVYLLWQDSRNVLAKDQYNIFFIGGFLDLQSLLVAGQRLGEACFIATAAYGSPFEPHVEVLREFRNQYLLTNRGGRWFVSTYYRLSPPAAHFIADHGYLRLIVRVALLPSVGTAWFFVHATPLQKLVIGISVVFAISLASFFILRHVRRD